MQQTSRSMMSGGVAWWELCETRVSCTVLRGAGGAIPPAYSPQPAVAAHPGQGALDDPANPFRDEGSAVTTGTGLDGDAKRLAGFGQPLAPVAEIAQSCPFEAAAGKLMQHWDDALAVMPVCRRDGDRQRETILVHGEVDPLIFLPPSKPRPKQLGAD